MKRLLIIFTIIWSILLPEANSIPSNTDKFLVIANPLELKFLMLEGDLPENQNSEDLYVGGVYSAKFHIQEVLDGDFPHKRLTAKIIAVHKGSLKKDREYILLINKNEHGEYIVVDWRDIKRLACLSKETIVKEEIEGLFDNSVSYLEDDCLVLPQ
ncbi:hypothetical protein [Kordiimonas sp. SCSIO 12610]|uniref:hypothetical protein n=1 Tax=Kordiimonas sp. SCSIO 12610 TaxID=2829597 RepID=UPI002109BE69|nr:hypothetical protein [Kordiimonas sp. SCSIO 12610]UTW53821.1 hypothetical protein KFF44_08165 [Kordiimonas sp. SCSIO 12610]